MIATEDVTGRTASEEKKVGVRIGCANDELTVGVKKIGVSDSVE